MVRVSQLTKDFYTSGDVAILLGVVRATVISWDKQGKLVFERTSTGRRLISKGSLMEFLKLSGLLVDDVTEARRDVIYARVSTHKQKKGGDLDRQVDFLKVKVADRNPVNLKVYAEVGSGLNSNRRELLKLLTEVMKGEVSRIFITYKDRLTRFGFEYLSAVAEFHGTEIVVVVNEEDPKSIQEELADDLVAIIHSFSGKLYGMRRQTYRKLQEEVCSIEVSTEDGDTSEA